MKPADVLSRDQLAAFTAKSDFHAWRLVAGSWLAIALILLVVARWPNPITIVVGLVLLAGRQLGLSVLMHECGHGTLFRTRWLNDWVGQWLCALPVMNDLPTYASGHLQHHRLAGTHDDPDLPNYRAYPVPRASFRRKLLRDLSGQTGIKILLYLARGEASAMSREQRHGRSTLVKQLFVQLVLFSILATLGVGWTYLLWVGAYLTVFMLVIRIRQVAEHAAVPDLYNPDPRLNTRTVEAPWWQRLVFAPNGVNYHLEHHFMASVPCYRLRGLHRQLKAAGVLDGVPVFNGYGDVLRHAVR